MVNKYMRPQIKGPKDFFIEKAIGGAFIILTDKIEIRLSSSIQDILTMVSLLYTHIITRHQDHLNKDSKSVAFANLVQIKKYYN